MKIRLLPVLLMAGMVSVSLIAASPAKADTVGGGLATVVGPAPAGGWSVPSAAPRFWFTLRAGKTSQLFGFVDTAGNWAALGSGTYGEIISPEPGKIASVLIGPAVFHAPGQPPKPCVAFIESVTGPDLFGITDPNTGKFISVGFYPLGTTDFRSGWFYGSYGWATKLEITP